jgi:hypothetical protein
MNDLRLRTPDLSSNSEIQTYGLGLINLFTSDLFEFINLILVKSEGNNWLQDTKVKDLKFAELNLKDPSSLLKELTRNGQSILRKPINYFVNKAQLKDFYDCLDDVLTERNSWVHNEVDPTPKSLEELIVIVKRIAWLLELSVIKECDSVLNLMRPEELEQPKSPELTVAPTVPTQISTNKDEKLKEINPDRFIGKSYTLHLSGSIRDRKTEVLLESVVAEAKEFGAKLLALKPSGGRLRITKEGELAGFEGDKWVYLAKVEPGAWFPGHLGAN